ncbi:hypothetical protein PS627_00065 [Pseudomonas fluorescens]|uniref:hypothetical protein n=1 Tax=Pseudomonas fluorescens TaxID=294 RepID=UPI00125949C3|nr:hypothetical protein [Pseudomonas fluorescens]CAG8863129.1 hypothetical protein PS627_00065 [Pseudomonas fluorescens]
MDTNKMRKQVSKEFEVFYADYEKSREANGWMPLETHVVVHMRNAWIASREAVVVSVPAFDDYPASMERDMQQSLRAAIEAQGLKVAP